MFLRLVGREAQAFALVLPKRCPLSFAAARAPAFRDCPRQRGHAGAAEQKAKRRHYSSIMR